MRNRSKLSNVINYIRNSWIWRLIIVTINILKALKKSGINVSKWSWKKAVCAAKEIAKRFNIGQFFFRNGHLFPPYVFSTALVSVSVFLIIQRALGVNGISDSLIGIVLGGAITYIAIFLHIDNKGNGVSSVNTAIETVQQSINKID